MKSRSSYMIHSYYLKISTSDNVNLSDKYVKDTATLQAWREKWEIWGGVLKIILTWCHRYCYSKSILFFLQEFWSCMCLISQPLLQLDMAKGVLVSVSANVLGISEKATAFLLRHPLPVSFFFLPWHQTGCWRGSGSVASMSEEK